jgi:hypothetical protein
VSPIERHGGLLRCLKKRRLVVDVSVGACDEKVLFDLDEAGCGCWTTREMMVPRVGVVVFIRKRLVAGT